MAKPYSWPPEPHRSSVPMVSDDDGFGEIVPNPKEAKERAHREVLGWAHALPWQVDRLYAARQAAMESAESVRAARFYGPEHAEPFYRLQAEVQFTLIAARQLVRALRAFDGDDRLPPNLSNKNIRGVRDALEHWDKGAESDAAKSLAKAGAMASRHRWSPAGPGILGDLISDAALRQWAVDVYAELVGWDSWREGRGD